MNSTYFSCCENEQAEKCYITTTPTGLKLAWSKSTLTDGKEISGPSELEPQGHKNTCVKLKNVISWETELLQGNEKYGNPLPCRRAPSPGFPWLRWVSAPAHCSAAPSHTELWALEFHRVPQPQSALRKKRRHSSEQNRARAGLASSSSSSEWVNNESSGLKMVGALRCTKFCCWGSTNIPWRNKK